tara:strand:- start:128 stop:868 length:741 start_codon:yes stop_codon:yes gene_type:complete
MPKVHRVGDQDSNGDISATGSDNVFANGGPTLGSGIAAALGYEDVVGIDEATARSIIEARSAELAAGRDPDLNEALEQFGGGSPGGINPIDGSTDALPAPGSDAAGDTPFDPNRLDSEWIIFQAHVNSGVLAETFNKGVALAKAVGKPLVANSGYRTPEYNKSIGGAKNSMHVQKKALDLQWPAADLTGRIAFIEKAIQAGFTGIGCYNGFMHVDIGPKRQWGPASSAASQYEQYKPILQKYGYPI